MTTSSKSERGGGDAAAFTDELDSRIALVESDTYDPERFGRSQFAYLAVVGLVLPALALIIGWVAF